MRRDPARIGSFFSIWDRRGALCLRCSHASGRHAHAGQPVRLSASAGWRLPSTRDASGAIGGSHTSASVVASRARGAPGAAERRGAIDRGARVKILASGTHPTADWRESAQSPKERYQGLMRGLQMVGRRNMLCGMHVHVELPDPDLRVNVMTRMLPYVPLLLALSTSSPFWQSECTGLKGYRLAAWTTSGRETGLPELFWSSEEYESYVLGPSSVLPLSPTQAISGGRSGHPIGFRRWSCEPPILARAWRTRSPSPRSFGLWPGTCSGSRV